MSNTSHWETRPIPISYAADPQSQSEHPSFYRAPTPHYVAPQSGYYTPVFAPTSAYYSDIVPLSAYPPHYTAPTPRYMTPEREYAAYPSADAYPTPDVSPDMRGKYQMLSPEEGDPAVVHAMARMTLKEYKDRRDGGEMPSGQGKSNVNTSGQGGSSSASSTESKGAKS